MNNDQHEFILPMVGRAALKVGKWALRRAKGELKGTRRIIGKHPIKSMVAAETAGIAGGAVGQRYGKKGSVIPGPILKKAVPPKAPVSLHKAAKITGRWGGGERQYGPPGKAAGPPLPKAAIKPKGSAGFSDLHEFDCKYRLAVGRKMMKFMEGIVPRENEFRMGIANEGEKELIRRMKAQGLSKDIPKAIMEKFDDESGDIEMSYLPLKGYPAGHGIPGGTMGRSKQKMPSGSGSPLKNHLSEDGEQEFDDGGFFDENELSQAEFAEYQAGQAFEQFSENQQMMFSVLGAIADRLGMSFSEDGDIYFAEDQGHEFADESDLPEYPLSEFDEHGNEYFRDESGKPYFFAEDGEAYYFKDDDDDDDWRAPAEQKVSDKDDPKAMQQNGKYTEFSDPALNGRITALEMREKHRNHENGVNQLVDHYAAQLSEYHLDTDDIERMREIAFSSSNPESALHQFSTVVAKNVPTDPPHTFTDYMSHDSYAANVPEDVQQFAEYGPDMYAAAESLWQPYQEYKASTNSQIEFKDYVKAQGVLGSTTNTGEGN